MIPGTHSDFAEPSARSLARLAGFTYIALFLLGVFANFLVREQLVVPHDAAATFRNVAREQALLRAAIVAFIAAFALDVVVAWALFHVFRPAGAALSSLAAWFRIVYTVFLGAAVVFLFAALHLVRGEAGSALMSGTLREAQMMLALEAFNVTWLIGLTCFGVHLGLLGVMARRSVFGSRLLGAALIVAGLAYVLDTLAYTMLTNYKDNASWFTAIVAVPAIVAEASLTVWLLRSRTP